MNTLVGIVILTFVFLFHYKCVDSMERGGSSRGSVPTHPPHQHNLINPEIIRGTKVIVEMHDRVYEGTLKISRNMIDGYALWITVPDGYQRPRIFVKVGKNGLGTELKENKNARPRDPTAMRAYVECPGNMISSADLTIHKGLIDKTLVELRHQIFLGWGPLVHHGQFGEPHRPPTHPPTEVAEIH